MGTAVARETQYRHLPQNMELIKPCVSRPEILRILGKTAAIKFRAIFFKLFLCLSVKLVFHRITHSRLVSCDCVVSEF